MKTSFNRKQLYAAVACALALGLVTGTVSAQAPSGAQSANAASPPSDRSLITNSTTSGSQVWRNGYGECWHSGYGPAPAPGADCNPAPIAPVAQSAPAPTPLVALPVAPAPQPAPVAAARPAPVPVVHKVSLDADALFDFDKAVLRPAGRAELDAFVSKLDGVSLDKITSVGHTDRFGSNSYNQTLSEKRADAVKNYLVAKGVQSNRIQTQGMGETQPVTKPGECLGAKSAKVVACLQPDRRVDVELIGSITKPQ